jgi:trk system potassium uptake protein TrkH
VLLAASFLIWLVLEWNGALKPLPLSAKLHNAWLQTVAPRTAGFNSVDLSSLSPAVVLLSIVLMLIGASPVSTGGGFKTTTAAVLFLAVRAVVAGKADAQAFGRRISPDVVYRAAAVATLAIAVWLSGALVLLITQSLPFPAVLFEAASALGTVGLSLGITPELDSIGKLTVMGLMFLGRTGPLTMVLLFSSRAVTRFVYPEERLMVG